MSADDLEEFYVHTVDVETFEGGGSWGESYTPHPGLRCFIDDSRRLVRDGQGAEVVSETTITAPPEYAPLFTPGSRVILPHRAASVITVAVAESGGLDLPDHVEAALT
jgi:hypothetical protein